LLSVPVQVIAWRTVSEMTYNVSSRTLNLTHSLSTSAASVGLVVLQSRRCEEVLRGLAMWSVGPVDLEHGRQQVVLSGRQRLSLAPVTLLKILRTACCRSEIRLPWVTTNVCDRSRERRIWVDCRRNCLYFLTVASIPGV